MDKDFQPYQTDEKLLAELNQIDLALEVRAIGESMLQPVRDLLRLDIATLKLGVQRGDAEAGQRARDLVNWIRESTMNADMMNRYRRTA
jgi:hypothetical protein